MSFSMFGLDVNLHQMILEIMVVVDNYNEENWSFYFPTTVYS